MNQKLPKSPSLIKKIIFLLLAVIFLLSTIMSSGVDALFGPDLNLTLLDPGTFSKTFSPRRIAVEVNLTFSKDSNIIGPVSAWIPVTNFSTKCNFTRFTWYQSGTLYPAQSMYSITFKNPILNWDCNETEAFKAMQNIFMTVGASSSARLVNSSVCVYFERLVVLNMRITPTDYFLQQWTWCHGIGGFLATMLKPYDEAVVRAALPGTLNDAWVGGWAVDNRPGDSWYCWYDDPDFESSNCKMNGYYAYYLKPGPDHTTTPVCARPPGLPCSSASLDWDCPGVSCAVLYQWYNFRFHRDTSQNPPWVFWDRSMNRTDLRMGAICTGLRTYVGGGPSGICHKPTILLSHPTLTSSITEDESASFSGTADQTATANTRTRPTPSISADHSMSESGTPDHSASLSPTKKTPTISSIRTASITGTAERSASVSRTVSKHTHSHSVDKSQSVSGTPDRTETGNSRTHPTPSHTSDRSLSDTGTADHTATGNTRTRPTPSLSADKSQSLSGTADHTATITRSKRTRTISADRTSSPSLTPDHTGTPSKSSSKRTRSISADRTGTVSISSDRTATGNTRTHPTPSRTGDRSLSDTGTADRTATGNTRTRPTPSHTSDKSQTVSISPDQTATGNTRTRPTPSHTGDKSLSDTGTADRTATGNTRTHPTHSHSFSTSLSDSISSTDTAPLTATKRTHTSSPSESQSESGTPDRTRSGFSKSNSKSPTPDRSQTLDTKTFTQTEDDTDTRSESFSDTDTEGKTRTSTITRLSLTKPRTRSESLSYTGETPSATFHVWTECGEGWTQFGGFCYKTWPLGAHRVNESLPTAMTFDDAQTWCNKFNAHIAPVQNVAQLTFLRDFIGKNSGRKFWNGVYEDKRFHRQEQVWRTTFNRSNFNDFFYWDGKRKMPHHEDCTVVHNYGDLSKRIVGGNDAMITYPCDARAEVICARLKDPFTITAVNQTTSGAILAVEGQPLVLSLVGRNIPRGMQVQLQTTSYTTHNGLEGQPTQCTEVRPRNPILLNVSMPAVALNITPSYRFVPICNGTCSSTNVHFPLSLKLERGKKYSVCIFLPYHYGAPTSSDEFRWNFLPDVWIEVAESRANFLRETCERRKELVEILYYDKTQTDAKRNVPTPWYFDGPIEPDNWQGVPGYKP